MQKILSRVRLGLTYKYANLFSNTKQKGKQQSPQQKILLTGLQPTGNLHLGNYFGSIQNILKHQSNPMFTNRFVFIADLHSLTTAFTNEHDLVVYNKKIGNDTFQMIRTLLACGINPQQTTIFIQSHIPQHSELTWILSCLANQHALNFMVQYKQKANQYSSVGLYTYPLLMASDILIYRSTHVPVGKDQVQHLQLANKVRERFNKIVGEEYLPHIKYVQGPTAKIMSLTNPDKKMSKSDVNQRSRIHLSDTKQQIHQKLRRATTDSEGNRISYDPENRKGLSNLIDIYSIVKGQTKEDVVRFAQQQNWGIKTFKQQLQEALWNKLSQIQKNKSQISDQQVVKVIKNGKQKARAVASQNMNNIKRLLNLCNV